MIDAAGAKISTMAYCGFDCKTGATSNDYTTLLLARLSQDSRCADFHLISALPYPPRQK